MPRLSDPMATMIPKLRPAHIVGKTLKAWRLRRGLSQPEVASRMKPRKSRTAIAMYECGAIDFRLSVLVDLASVLGVTLADLLTSVEDGREEPS